MSFESFILRILEASLAEEGTAITNSDASANDDLGKRFETICDRSGFRIKRNGSIMETWDGYKTIPRFGERFRQPQDFVRGKKHLNEGATSIRPRQTDREFNTKTWNTTTLVWDQGTGGVDDVSSGDL